MSFTKKDFGIFKKECEKYIEKLGLKEWRVDIFFEPTTKLISFASTACNITNRSAIIRLNPKHENAEKCNIRKTAKHEVLELLLCCLNDMAKYSYQDDIVDRERHSIIRRLEKIL